MKKVESLAGLLIICTISISASDDTLVQVQQGWLAGEHLQAVTKDMYYYSFKGIPYAAPPVGDLRFKATQPSLCWEGVRNATQHGSVCPQANNFNYSEITNGSEDCLFLNVYTPSLNPDDPLTVLVFFHGGGYMSGSGNDDNYGPDFLVRKNVVFVTANYRLDALGFLCMDNEEIPGNAGMKDQVAVLEWVQDNIAAFGGDPNKVTIMGQSAGSASVGYHILSPRSKGLFHRAIAFSGVPFCDFSLISYQPKRRAFSLGKLLGFMTRDDDELIAFLRNVEPVKLVGTLSTVLASEEIITNLIKLYQFVPVVEKTGSDPFLAEEPSVILSEGRINAVDVMFGYTNEEALIVIPQFEEILLERYDKYAELLVPTKILYTSPPDLILDLSVKIFDRYFGNTSINTESMRQVISYINNATFVYDIHRFFSKFPKLENKSMYLYKFSSVSKRNVYGAYGAPYGISGAAHLDDMMYLFDAKSMNMTIDKNSTEFALIDQATTIFTNFAKYGNPTPDSSLGVTWPEYNNETSCYVDIGSNLTTGCALDEDDVLFWKNILELANLTF